MKRENRYAESASSTMYKNLKKQEFLFNDRVIVPLLNYGQTSVDVTNKKFTFQELCVQADQSLKKASSSNVSAVDEARSRFSGRKYSNKDLDLWAAIKYVIDGEYDLIPDKHRDMLVKCMQTYIDHVSMKT